MRIAVAGGTGTVGRYVVEAARRAGHEPVVLSRSTGVDLATGAGLAAGLDGVDVVVDASNTPRTSRPEATAFFTGSARRLQDAAATAGARHLVTVSIVGLERVPGYGYYQAKLAQEEVAGRGPLPVTIVRATQFHEFPGQILGRTRRGPVAVVPRMRVQTVAARTVGETVVDVVARLPVDAPAQALVEVAGAEPADLVDLARLLLRHERRRVAVVPVRLPGAAGRAMRAGALLPGPGVRRAGPTFAAWLDSADHHARPADRLARR